MGLADDRWINLLVAAPIERVREALRDEKAAFLLTVNAPGLCVVGGAERACERLTRRLGTAVTVAPLGYDIAAHAPVLGEARDELRRLYHRTVRADGTARFYTGTTGRSYVPTSDTVAETLTTMTLEPVDFAATVRNVWDDGVRLFVEHGPRDLCSRWISATLQDRDHLTVALDGGEGGGEGGGESGAGSFAALAQAVAELAAAGVVTASGPVLDRLGSGRRAATAPARSLVIPAHPPAVGESPSSVEPPPAAGPPRSGDRAPDRHRGVRSEGAVTLDRTRLEQLAAGKMSEVFDDRWTAVDERARRTRMPEPPMLLADRVLDIDAEPFSMRGGTIWTETDIGRDAWYLDGCGRIPAGLLVEAGQADLLLLSWLGVDLHVDDDRVYRLLGCDLTFHGSPPGIGATCRYEIGVDGHGRHGDVHLFFFHSRCDVEGQAKLTVTNGQAGYFTDEELAASQGVLWEAAGEPSPKGRVCLPAAASPGTFGFAAVRALSEGRPDLCFGRDWRITRAHLRTPRIGHGRLRLLHRVPVFDPRGGPWKRGYLRAEFSVSPQEWFFPGHFTNDPCMPGTLMLEGCLQAMAFYLTACGFTLDRDGWRFEPVPETSYELRCRGQVTPRSRLLTYELFVSEVSGAPEPALHADALCTVDGVKAFHARGLGLRLVPDSPFAHWSRLTPPATQPTGEPVPAERLGGLLGHRDERPAAVTADGRRLDHPALLAAAWGTPAEDGGRVTARLPGPPYLFVSRITEFSTTESACVTAEYDVPRHAWYWEQSGSPAAPLAVLVEIAQQPCAWLLGQLPASAADRPARLRYLGGTMTVLGELSPSAETVRTTARLTGRTRRGTTTVHTFSVTCHADGNPLLSVSTSCALLPAADTAWPDDVSPAPRRAAPPDAACSPIDLRTRPPEFFAGRPRLPGPMLLMIDRLTGRWPDGGARGLGRFRAEREIDPADWYFRAHHFQDPVLPGSLVIEAMGQLLQISMLQDGAPGGRFCSPPGHTMTWTHHGQVTPACDRVILDMEITQVGADAAGRHAVADAWLWAGGSCVCQAHAIAARIVPPPPLRTAVRTQERTSNTR
jgi:3-hydroxymyristoyl/3-hydroxydecanoyl-(acyl carrier protein) dehydratase